MKLEIFAIRDRQLDAFMQPWTAQTIGQATRIFADEVNKPGEQMHKHADDYDLYHLATFQQHTGEIVKLGKPQQIAIGKNVKEN